MSTPPGAPHDARRSPHGSADRNRSVPPSMLKFACRSPHGSADRNTTNGVIEIPTSQVAPRTGARIETLAGQARLRSRASRSPHGSADRNSPGNSGRCHHCLSLPARERGSKPGIDQASRAHAQGRSPHGSADRNLRAYLWMVDSLRRSPHGSADRNSRVRPVPIVHTWSLPARERGSKHAGAKPNCPQAAVAPRTGARIET